MKLLHGGHQTPARLCGRIHTVRDAAQLRIHLRQRRENLLRICDTQTRKGGQLRASCACIHAGGLDRNADILGLRPKGLRVAAHVAEGLKRRHHLVARDAIMVARLVDRLAQLFDRVLGHAGVDAEVQPEILIVGDFLEAETLGRDRADAGEAVRELLRRLARRAAHLGHTADRLGDRIADVAHRVLGLLEGRHLPHR